MRSSSDQASRGQEERYGRGGRMQTRGQERANDRKHNSPDYNKYRAQPRKHSPEAHPKKAQPVKQKDANAANGQGEGQQEDQHYLKLHEKLNFIEAKIAEMKVHVQRKRQEKQELVEARRKRQAEREADRREQARAEGQGRKLDLKQFVTQVPEHGELHSVDKDPYSSQQHVYYVSEVVKSYKDEKSLAREHLLTSLHIFRILGGSRFATDEEMEERLVRLPRRAGYEGKKTVVFDLDETLIHCNDTLTPPYDVKLPITFPTGEVIEAGINIRPHAVEILAALSSEFEVVVFTASHSCYANVVLDFMDPEGVHIHHRLFREHCYQTPEGMYCKDLRVMDRDLKDVVLVDNAAYSYAAQPDNGIPILPYYHGKQDFELRVLEEYLLKEVAAASDVREPNRATFQLHHYPRFFNHPEQLVEELYMRQAQ